MHMPKEIAATWPAGLFPHAWTRPGDANYTRWRDQKLYRQARAPSTVVNIARVGDISAEERQALLERVAARNFAIYAGPSTPPTPAELARFASALGLHDLLEDGLPGGGIVTICAKHPATGQAAGEFIPYTDRALNWHTDGYYNAPGDAVGGFVLHCVAPALRGGESALCDHEAAYIELAERDPGLVAALMADDTMHVPEHRDANGALLRPARSGPVFWVEDNALRMRYTARTRSICWRSDAATDAARRALTDLLARRSDSHGVLRLNAGQGIVCNNVLHARKAFVDAERQPRTFLRARFRDRVAQPHLRT